ncbi:ion channel [Flavobacterium sp. RSB2_4_14]|uniref:ion channel n=1 Tax=Flavobacterium sp. RSB2_4_14 TaxID=3447665 RepID=UPI003F2A423F
MKQSFLYKFRTMFSSDGRKTKSAIADGMLLLMTVISIFVIPVLPNEHFNLLYTCSVMGIIIFSVLSLKKNSKIIKGFAVFTTTFIWVAYFVDLEFIRTGFRFVNFFFFLFLVFSLIKQVSSTGTVTFKVLVDSITAYLLLGFAFSLMVTFISLNIPNAYNISHVSDFNSGFVLTIQNNIYYTFSTYTTTGYGDITPTHPLSKSLAVLISVSGQLYVAVIISMLVGKYISFKKPPQSI